MTDVCTNIKDILLAANVANFPGASPVSPTTTWKMELYKMPADTEVIGIINTGGKVPNPKWAIDYPSVQVMLRGNQNDSAAAVAMAQKVKDALLGFSSATVNGDRIDAINMIGDITSLGFDENNCPMFSVNFSLIVEPANTGNRAAL